MSPQARVVLPKGFKASARAAGIKKSGKPDLALFFSEVPARAACKFTTNKIQAAPVIISRRHLKKSRFFRAIIVNSGNANCFTGRRGLRDAELSTAALARAIGVKKESVLVASTGIIARRLAVGRIIKAVPGLVKGLSLEGIDAAKKAILTTDKFTKEATVKFSLDGRQVTVCGIAKGAGMIAPNLATMLAFVFTDADITQRALSKALGTAVDNSFNCITVDGCMSTNDAVMVMANGASQAATIDIGRHFGRFEDALCRVCLELAKLVVKDAEGATKFITVKVRGARSLQDARKIALNIANSSLFKTAVYGENPNYGRIIAAAGASGASVSEGGLEIKVSPLNKKEIEVDVFVSRGSSSAVVYTSDLTPDYIKINAEYN